MHIFLKTFPRLGAVKISTTGLQAMELLLMMVAAQCLQLKREDAEAGLEDTVVGADEAVDFKWIDRYFC